MGTISKRFVCYGFCPIDEDDVTIEVEYTSLQLPNEDKKRKKFTKSSNCCYYLSQGKCDKRNDCPVFLEAEVTRYEDYSKVRY